MNQDGPAPAEQHLGAVHQPGLHVELHPRPAGLAGHRAASSCWACRPGRSARKEHVDAFRRAAVISLAVLLPAVVLGALRGQRARRDRGDVPADEDRRRRGAVEHLRQPLLVLRRSRSVGATTTTPPPRSSPSPACCPSWPPTASTGRSRGSTSSTRSTRRSTGPGTTSPTSSSSTGRCGSWPTWPPWSSSSPCGGRGCCSGKRLDRSKWFLRIAPWVVILPFLINTAGWMLTENGRQPWIVQGLMKTAQGVSPSVSATDIWISSSSSCLVFVVLGVADTWLMLRYGRRELGHDPWRRSPKTTAAGPSDRPSPTRPTTTSRRSSTRRGPP